MNKKYLKVSKYGAYVFIVSTIVLWIIYFMDIPTPTEFSSAMFSRIVNIIQFIYLASIPAISFAFLFQKSKRERLFGLTFVMFFLFMLIVPALSNILIETPASYEDQELYFNLVDFFIIVFMLLTPILFAIIYRLDNLAMMFIVTMNVITWSAAYAMNLSSLEVFGARYGGLYYLDLIFSIIMIPFLAFIYYLGSNIERLLKPEVKTA